MGKAWMWQLRTDSFWSFEENKQDWVREFLHQSFHPK